MAKVLKRSLVDLSPTPGSSTERSVSKTNRPRSSCKGKRGHVEDQPSHSVTSSSELSSSSDGEDGWRYKRQKKTKPFATAFCK